MMTFRKIAAGKAGRLIRVYMTEQSVPAAERGLAGYYTGQESRAAWKPDMAAGVAQALGIDLARPPEDETLDRLFEAKRGRDGAAWSRHARSVSAYDLTFSAHKSVSLAVAFAPTEAEQAALIGAHEQAVDAAMRYVAQEIGWARRGKGGCLGAETGEVGWVRFLHFTSRPTLLVQDGPDGATYPTDIAVPSDPQLHSHNAIFNAVVTASGHVGSLDSQRIQGRVHEFGAYYQAQLAERLRALGVDVGYDQGEQAVAIRSIPQSVCDAFSNRHREVARKAKDFARTMGLSWDEISAERKSGLMQAAAVRDRQAKNDGMTDRETWEETAARLGWRHRSVLGAEAGVDPATAAAIEAGSAPTDVSPRQSTPQSSPEQRLDAAYAHAARHVAEAFHTKAVLGMNEMRTHAARALIGTGLAGPEDIDRVVDALEARGIRLHGAPARLIVGLQDGQLRVTNSAQIAIEEGVTELAAVAATDRSGALLPAEIAAAITAAGLDRAGDPEHAAAQRAAIHALGEGGKLGVVIGVAGAGKTTLMTPLVRAWQARGREVIGLGLAWRQADALQETGIGATYAVAPFLEAVASGAVRVGRNTVLAIDEIGQVGPRQFLALLEIQQATGCSIKALGDPEQCQAIEAGDTMELLRRVLPKAAMPELLSTVRQETRRARHIAGLFREGRAGEALALKREDGTAMLVGGDEEQVIDRIAVHYLARRDARRAAGVRRGVTISAPTNADAAVISLAIRDHLRVRGEIGADEIRLPAIDPRGERYDLAVATGDRLRLYRKTFGMVDGHADARPTDARRIHLGSNGQVVTVAGHDREGLWLQAAGSAGVVAHVSWEKLTDPVTGRVLLGHGHCLTIDSAQGITSGEHINALPRGSTGVTAFKAYVAESRHVSQVWTLVGEAAEREAERVSRPLGDARPVTEEDLWARIGRNLSEKPYKPLGLDLLAQVRRDQRQAAEAFTAGRGGVQRASAERDPAAAARARVEQAGIGRSLDGRIVSFVAEALGQRQAAEDIARDMAAPARDLAAALEAATRQAAGRIAAHRRPPEPPTPTRRSSPSPGF
jgi:hypothetical protein